jgi:hypothetical protein
VIDALNLLCRPDERLEGVRGSLPEGFFAYTTPSAAITELRPKRKVVEVGG